MSDRLHFTGGVTLLGGAPDVSCLDAALAVAPGLICADGGANALPEGRLPDAVIGDLDSLDRPEAWRARLGARLIHVTEQDSTDLEKCLRRSAAEYFIGVGFLGGRADHELAAFHVLVSDPRPIVLLSRDDVIFSAGLRISLALEAGDRISVFPMRAVTGGPCAGLRWPVDGLALEAGGRIGTSNEATGPVTVSFGRPGAIIILPRRRLDAALAGLLKRDTPENHSGED